MFKLTQAVPEIYVNKSRDFQLLCRLIESLTAYTHISVDKLQTSLDPFYCDERLLPLLATRVGFFYDGYLPAEVLRSILAVYPDAIKHKGTNKAIEMLAVSVLKASSDITFVHINVSESDPHTLVVFSDGTVESIQYLQAALQNIVPAGYHMEYMLGVVPSEPHVSNITIKNVISIRKEDLSHSTRIISTKQPEEEIKTVGWENLNKSLATIDSEDGIKVTRRDTQINHLIRIVSQQLDDENNRIVYVRSDK